jgi:cytochrome P450
MSLNMKFIPGPKGHWLKGNLGQFDKHKIHNYFYKSAREFGGTSRVRFMHKKFVIFQNSETVKYLLKHRPEKFRRAKMMEQIFNEMGINGVFSAESNQWQKQRMLMNPAFRPSQIKAFYPSISQITHRLIRRLNKNLTDVDIQSILMSYTVDITSSLAFGKDVNTLDNAESLLQQHLNIIFPTMSYRMRAVFPYWHWFKLQRDRRLDEALNVVKCHVDEFIKAAKEKITTLGFTSVEQAENLLEAMILTRDSEGDGFSEQEIFSNVVTLLLAGEDTTANTLSWVFDYLVDKQELQEKLYHEIIALFGQDEVMLDNLNELPLLSGVIHESMRLRPVAPHLYLEPIKDEIVEGYSIPAGTTIVALLSGEGFDDQVFPQPYNFDPFRWVNLSEEVKRDYAARLLPFGYGARLCPGRQLALVEMRLSLVEIIRRFRFVRSSGTTPADEIIKFTLQPLGLRIDFIKR